MSERLLLIEEVSEITRVPVETLRWWRKRDKGEGPRSARIGRRVAYRASDVDAWIAEQFDDSPGSHLRAV